MEKDKKEENKKEEEVEEEIEITKINQKNFGVRTGKLKE